MRRSYSELSRLKTFEDRFAYLRIGGGVGVETFGTDRYLNQRFYKSPQWLSTRDFVIARDLGCDLGVEGYEIHHRILVHHMNPIEVVDITDGNSDILSQEYLITTTHQTHNAIHYGLDTPYEFVSIERTPGDTNLW